MIKIGIDPSGTGTTGIVVYEDNKLIEKQEFTNKNWINHTNEIISFIKRITVYHTHFGDCKKTRKNNKIYNLKYKNIIKNNTYINKNSKIDTLKNSLNKTL